MIAHAFRILYWMGATAIALVIITGVIMFVNFICSLVVDFIDKLRARRASR